MDTKQYPNVQKLAKEKLRLLSFIYTYRNKQVIKTMNYLCQVKFQ